MFNGLRSHRLKLKLGKSSSLSPGTGEDLSGVSSIGSSFLSTNMNQLDEISKESIKITPNFSSPLKKQSKSSMNQQLSQLKHFEKIKDIEQFLKLEDELLNSVDSLSIDFLKKKLISNLIISLFKFFKSNININNDGHKHLQRLIDLNNTELYNDIQNVVNNLISVISSMTSTSVKQDQSENNIKSKEIVDDEFEDSENDLVLKSGTIRSFSRLINNDQNNFPDMTPTTSRSRLSYYNNSNNKVNNESGLTTPFRTFTPAFQQNSVPNSVKNNFNPFSQYQHQYHHSRSHTNPNVGSMRFDLQPPPMGPPQTTFQQQQQQQMYNIPQNDYTATTNGTLRYQTGRRYNNDNGLNNQMMSNGITLQSPNMMNIGYPVEGQNNIQYNNMNNPIGNPYVDVYYQ